MGNFIDIASGLLSQSTQRAEIAAQNIANITTPGYKRRIGFSQLLAPGAAAGTPVPAVTATDFSIGDLTETGNPHDLAIGSAGFFVLRDQGGLSYARQGQFQRDADGRLKTAQGAVLQAQDGGDLVLRAGAFEVTAAGIVIQAGEPVARIAVVDFPQDAQPVVGDSGAFHGVGGVEMDAPLIRQGMLEASNVSMGDEMIALMEALRRAETSQRLINVYDDLMGRAISTFGQA